MKRGLETIEDCSRELIIIRKKPRVEGVHPLGDDVSTCSLLEETASSCDDAVSVVSTPSRKSLTWSPVIENVRFFLSSGPAKLMGTEEEVDDMIKLELQQEGGGNGPRDRHDSLNHTATYTSFRSIAFSMMNHNHGAGSINSNSGSGSDRGVGVFSFSHDPLSGSGYLDEDEAEFEREILKQCARQTPSTR
jgi:hypothetical protein